MKTSFHGGFASIILLAVLCLTSCGPMQAPNDPGEVDKAFSELIGRLKDASVPLQSAKVTEYTPIVLDFVINANSEKATGQSVDVWNRAIVEREATLAYLSGLRVQQFTISFVNAEGKLFGGTTTFLYESDLSQQLKFPQVDAFNDKQTSESLVNDLDFHGMTVRQLGVSSKNPAVSLGQYLEILLEVNDEKLAIDWAATFAIDLHTAIDKINQESDSHISLARIQIRQNSAKLLFDYIYDADLKAEYLYKVPAIPSWLPEPMATGTPIPAAELTRIGKPSPQAPVKTLVPYPGNDTKQDVPVGPTSGYP